jgi:hypothetical protein
MDEVRQHNEYTLQEVAQLRQSRYHLDLGVSESFRNSSGNAARSRENNKTIH